MNKIWNKPKNAERVANNHSYSMLQHQLSEHFNKISEQLTNYLETCDSKSKASPTTEIDQPIQQNPAERQLSRVITQQTQAVTPPEEPLQVDIREFGGVIRSFGESASETEALNNRDALQLAMDWSANVRGVVYLPAGVLNIAGTVTRRPFSALHGLASISSCVKQNMLPSSLSEGFVPMFDFPSISGTSGGTAFTQNINYMIDGGWDGGDHNQDTHSGWNFDPARMTGHSIMLDTPLHGVSGLPDEFAGIRDGFNVISGMIFRRTPGYHIHMSGRGENVVNQCQGGNAALSGMFLDSPDNWITCSTFYNNGDNGMVVTGNSGDLRISDIKTWFNGRWLRQEPRGVGLYLRDPGLTSVTITNFTTQDNYSAGFELSGSTGITIQGIIDEPGGGRIEQQGLAYAGTRTRPRTAIILNGTLRRAHIDVSVKGGGRNGLSNRPNLVNITGSGVMGCHVKTNGDLTHFTTPYVHEAQGSRNQGRYNIVQIDGKLVHGFVSQEMLDDPDHGVNDPLYGPTQVIRDDGWLMIKDPDGLWIKQGPADVPPPPS